MSRLWLVVVAGCAGSATPPPSTPAGDQGIHADGGFAPDDEDQPTYGPAELQRALIAERGVEASDERRVAELEAKGLDDTDDTLRVARANLAVRRRFIATLESCAASHHACPPRLDDPSFAYDFDGNEPPPLDAPLRFDLASWRTVAAELHGRACACRTITCVDALGFAIEVLEPRPMPAVRGDDTASLSITRARECLFRLRGKHR